MSKAKRIRTNKSRSKSHVAESKACSFLAENKAGFQMAVAKGGLPADKWVQAVEREHGVLLKDIRSLQPGQHLELLLLDRNWGDRVYGTKPAHIYTRNMLKYGFAASLVLRPAGATFIQGSEMPGKGTLVFWSDGLALDNWTVEVLDTKRQMWRPVEGDASENKQALDLASLPDTTKIGYRGPAIPWNKVYRLPPILPLPCDGMD
jgi:hypothetical protein